jgi:TolA-binding protein
VAFNLAALEAADTLFAEEHYRDALWVYRLVYPYDTVLVRGEEFLERQKEQAEQVKNMMSNPRELMRLQESIGELEAEMEAIRGVPSYDLDLYYRIAMGYMEMMRYREGEEIFMYLHRTAEGRMAEESLFLAFRCACYVQPWTHAFELGEMYMQKYPSGEFFDMLTLAMGQMYARLQDWPTVIRHLTKTLEMSPNHQSAAECMFLIGYASFMTEKFDDAISWLTKMRTRFPENDMAVDALYWIAMSHLFKAEYEVAGKHFAELLERFPQCVYVEDSSFRRAVCLYGQSLLEESDRRLKDFLAAYPNSKLASEATMMRADIAGAEGRLKEAVEFYQAAMASPDLNIEFYNHCAFQAGRILVEDEKYKAVREHFDRYIGQNREGANFPQAIYWIGVSLWNEGEQEGALRYYREAVQKYGKDRKAIGIDMILDEWVGRAKRSPIEQAAKAWQDLRDGLVAAQKEGNKIVEYRLKRALLYDPHVKPSEHQAVLNEFSSPALLPMASAAVLQQMLDLAQERKDHALAAKVAEEIITTFTETDYALDARMMLADHAIRQAAEAKTEADRDRFYDEAIKHLGVVSEVYAATGEGGQALVLLGKLYTEQGKYKEADAAYKSVLGVKDWRPLWPESLYGRGECAFVQRQYDVAAAYYERVYVMYSHYTAWTAKAYLRRAECLRRAYQIEKAREVLREMLGNKDLAASPEAEEARQLMKKLGEST